MNNVSPFYSKNDIQEEACLWVSRMDRGLSAIEEQDLFAWIKRSNIHHSTLFEMASHWDDLSVLNELSGVFPLEQPNKKSKNKLMMLAMAASIALVSLFTTNMAMHGKFWPKTIETTASQSHIYQTQLGEQEMFSLPDGSNILLNTNSVVKIDFNAKHRHLTLLQGEARFDVAKDKNRPFTVTSGQQSFTALGTIFNVQKDDELNMELMVTEGRVLITKAEQSLKDISTSLVHLAEDKLPGRLVVSSEKATIIKNITLPTEQVALDEIQRDLAWQQGMLIFEGEPLKQVLAEVSRYSTEKFEIIDPQLMQINVAGYFKVGDTEGLLASLAGNFNIVATQTDNHIIHLSAAHL